jgi:hypothetical protein
VRLLFLDESGKLDQGGLFALGGIAIHDASWLDLKELWQAALREAGWPIDRETTSARPRTSTRQH